MEKETVDQLKGMFEAAVKPVADKVDSLGWLHNELKKSLEEAHARIKKMEDAPALRVDASGKPVDMGGQPAAPAIVRKDSLGDRPYSIANVARAMLERDPKYATFEFEVSNVLKGMGFPSSHNGSILVPMGMDFLPDMGDQAEKLRKMLDGRLGMPAIDQDEYVALAKAHGLGHVVRKVMDPLSDTQGGTLIPFPERGELIELLRTSLVTTQAGARFVPLPQGGLDYPTETGRTTFAWRQMGVQSDISESSPTTGSVKLTPKELAGLTKVPNSLIRFSRPAAEALVRRSLSNDAALAADLGYLEGQGGTAPLGILFYPFSAAETPTINKVTLHIAGSVGANGDTLTPEDIMKMIALVEEAPDAEGPTAWILRPLFWAKIANLRAGSGFAADDGKGPFMFPVTRGALSGAVQKEMAGYKVVTSTQINRTRNKGTDATLTYLLLANWRRMVIGVVGALELAVSTEAGFARNETWFRAILYTDSALLHPESFVLTDTLIAV